MKENPLSEELAQMLLQKEKNGRARKFLLTVLSAQVRKAKRRRELKESQDELMLAVWNSL